MMIAHTTPKDSDVRITGWLAWLFLAATGCAASCPTHQPKEGSALVQLEQHWAEALSRHDADAVGCILGEEFQDVDPDGQRHNRAETLAAIPGRKPGINRLSELAPHVYGDFAYIRGLATLLDPAGNIKARVRFTDVYVYRDGRWLAVAGQESRVPPGAK
ncbi:MAG TPA: nuclear transport factor 2 family protein [Terriglobales bacterium]|nr:nuclear transport factor 2 family protein [Terriglobales bacterium]